MAAGAPGARPSSSLGGSGHADPWLCLSATAPLSCVNPRPSCQPYYPRAASPPKMLICCPAPAAPLVHTAENREPDQNAGGEGACGRNEPPGLLGRPFPHRLGPQQAVPCISASSRAAGLPGVPSSPPSTLVSVAPKARLRSSASSFPEDALPGHGIPEPLFYTPPLGPSTAAVPPAAKADTFQSLGVSWCSLSGSAAGIQVFPPKGKGMGKSSRGGGGEGREAAGRGSRLGASRLGEQW